MCLNRIIRAVSLSLLLAFTACSSSSSNGNGGSTTTSSSSCPIGDICAFVGSSTANGSYGGDGGQATQAQIHDPYGITVDSQSNVYIADTSNNRIRLVNSSGVISTVAGNGTKAYGGDLGAAIAAQLNGPYAVAVSPSLDIYIADTGNNAVRRVDHTTGIMTTIA